MPRLAVQKEVYRMAFLVLTKILLRPRKLPVPKRCPDFWTLKLSRAIYIFTDKVKVPTLNSLISIL